jgi:hypothetical protein
MSRAINLDVAQPDVIEMCRKHNAGISAIERLAGGGTRVVLDNADGAALIARSFGGKVIEGPVRRTPFISEAR